MSINIRIAIDGTAASGKGTLAKSLCKEFGLAYLDTGKLYRFLAYIIIEEKIDYSNLNLIKNKFMKHNFAEISTLGPELKKDNVGKIASIIAGYKDIREILLDYQKKFAFKNHYKKNGVILDGRDIGTIVLPDAHIKFYVDASVEIRAERRWKELISLGQSIIKRNVLQDLRNRDKRDSQRKYSPLVPASDAILLDTTNLDADEVFLLAKEYVVNYLN